MNPLHKYPLATFILGFCVGGLTVNFSMTKLCNVENTKDQTVFTCKK